MAHGIALSLRWVLGGYWCVFHCFNDTHPSHEPKAHFAYLFYFIRTFINLLLKVLQ
jgi:hypothetical protein